MLHFILLFLYVWECLISNKKHFLAAKKTKCGYPATYKSAAWARNDSEFNFHFQIHKLEADY